MIEPMDTSGRWWLVHGIEVDLNAVEGTYPLLLRAAALARRDADTPEERDIAAYLEWVSAEDGRGGELIAVEFLARKAWQLVACLNERMGLIERRRSA